MIDDKLATQLVLDELFDLSLYREFAKIAGPETRVMFEELIPIEEKHFAFWRKFFKKEDLRELNVARKIKLEILLFIARVFGESVMHLILEAIEIYGIRKYLTLWEAYKADPFGEALREILTDEFGHEDAVVSRITERKIDPRQIRDIFFGMNDGLVEVLGAISGFFAAFHSQGTVFIASFTVAVAGAISMGAGAYVASSSQAEVEATETGRKRFFGEATSVAPKQHSLRSALVTGISYFFGALIPVIPVFFGVTSVFWPAIVAGVLIIGVSFVLAFLSGMAVEKRIFTNVVIMTLAVVVTYAIGIATTSWWGIRV